MNNLSLVVKVLIDVYVNVNIYQINVNLNLGRYFVTLNFTLIWTIPIITVVI